MAVHATTSCSGTNKETGLPCKARPIKGGTVCRMHGGSLPRTKAAAQLRLARDAAQQELIVRMKTAGRSERQDAVTELDRLAAEVIVFKDIVRERLDELLAGELRYEGKTGEQLRAEVALYERALDRCNTVLATNVKLGIAERKAALRKAEVEMLALTIRVILNRLGLTREQKILAGQVVPEELRAISAAVSEP